MSVTQTQLNACMCGQCMCVSVVWVYAVQLSTVYTTNMAQKQIKHNQIISTRLVFIDKLYHTQYFDNINYSLRWQLHRQTQGLPVPRAACQPRLLSPLLHTLKGLPPLDNIVIDSTETQSESP